MANEIKKGSTVKYKGGFYSVKSLFKTRATLGMVFDSSKIRHRNVPISELSEAQEEHYEQWSKSESYMCM